MKGKLAFVLGAAIGYVLGARAGRERYEQIKRGAQRVWQTEPVQRGVHLVKEAVDDRADDLKAFAVRLGNDVFSNLAKSRAQTGGESGAEPAGAKSAAARPAGAGSGDAKPAPAESSGAKPAGAKSAGAKSSGATSSGAKSDGKSGGKPAASKRKTPASGAAKPASKGGAGS